MPQPKEPPFQRLRRLFGVRTSSQDISKKDFLLRLNRILEQEGVKTLSIRTLERRLQGVTDFPISEIVPALEVLGVAALLVDTRTGQPLPEELQLMHLEIHHHNLIALETLKHRLQQNQDS